MNILVVAGHPDLPHSVANATILEELARAFPQAAIRKLCETAPGGQFDVAAEQQALQAADLIVWQFPFWWFSMPWLLKKWQDDVLLYGFAYGSGSKLGGKRLLVSFTTGAPAAAYTGAEGSVGDIEKMVEPFATTARFCGLDWQGAMWLTSVSYSERATPEAVAQQQQAARDYAAKLIARIRAIGG